MSTKQIRASLHQNIDQIDDRFLRVLYVMTATYLKEQEDALLESQVNAIPPNESWSPMTCLLYTSPSPRDRTRSRMPSSA